MLLDLHFHWCVQWSSGCQWLCRWSCCMV